MSARFRGRRRRLRLALAIPVLGFLPLFLLAARQPERPGGVTAQLAKAPSRFRSMTNPYDGKPEAMAAGRKLYGQHCAECHGPEGYGREQAVNLHSPEIQDAPPGVLFWAVRNGRIRKGMPAWSRLPDEQIWQLVSFLKTLK